ncbi:sensor histidine kinase [Rhizobium sp. SAFR-030]|uniref:sensor histidine kinase n=1 Tax=Rhizobium sp. SAFR-030 TaxID=3387277 RepID=UPI003F816189
MEPLRLLKPAAGIDGAAASRRSRAVAGLAFILAVTVFWVDAFTTIESAIAVLYVIVLLLSAEALTTRGIWLTTAACLILTLSAYVIGHGLAYDLPALLRLAVSLAALFITRALIFRNDMFRSELLASNAALSDSERRYRSIFEESRVALWERDYSAVRTLLMRLKSSGIVNLKQHVTRHPAVIQDCINLIRTVAANEAARTLFGDLTADLGELPMRRYLTPDDATFIDLLAAIFEEHAHFEGKGHLITSDGQKRLVLISMSFPEDRSAFNRIIVGMVDITAREMTQKALLEAQAELTRASRAATVGALSASLAHELNQPLAALVLNAQTMLRWINRETPDLEAVRRSAERMIRDSQRASDIIHNTRSMLSHELRAPEPVNLPDLIAETKALMEHDLNREGVTFEAHCAQAADMVDAVRIELQQVLINLITNGIQAMSGTDLAERRLLVSTQRRDDGFISICVRDFGPGIGEDVMPRLFAPFFTTKPTGMGMGLSICRSTMEARGGELLARNHPDGGAVFDMLIPTQEAARG